MTAGVESISTPSKSKRKAWQMIWAIHHDNKESALLRFLRKLGVRHRPGFQFLVPFFSGGVGHLRECSHLGLRLLSASQMLQNLPP